MTFQPWDQHHHPFLIETFVSKLSTSSYATWFLLNALLASQPFRKHKHPKIGTLRFTQNLCWSLDVPSCPLSVALQPIMFSKFVTFQKPRPCLLRDIPCLHVLNVTFVSINLEQHISRIHSGIYVLYMSSSWGGCGLCRYIYPGPTNLNIDASWEDFVLGSSGRLLGFHPPGSRGFIVEGRSSAEKIPSLKLTVCTWKWMVGILVSFWETLSSGAMLVSGRVYL